MSQDQTIFNLKQAVEHFKNRFPHALHNKVSIPPVYEKLGKQYFDNELSFGDKENEYDMLVRKQEPRDWISDKPIAQILAQDITNGLGITDVRYYCVIFRKKWLGHWASSLDNDKYRSTSGIFIPFNIIDYIRHNKLKKLTTLVLVLSDGRTYTAKIEDIMNFIFKLKIFLFINAYGTMQTGVPKELFKEEL